MVLFPIRRRRMVKKHHAATFQHGCQAEFPGGIQQFYRADLAQI